MIVSYNARGDEIEARYFEPNGTPRSRHTYEYDDRNRKTSETNYDGAGAIKSRAVYVYDSCGRAGETLLYNGDGVLLTRRAIGRAAGSSNIAGNVTYDGAGNVLRRETNTRDAASGSSIWTRRDAAGEPVGSTTFSLDDPQRHVVTEHNADGSLAVRRVMIGDSLRGSELQMIEYDPAGKVVRHKREAREFDAEGNIVKTIESYLNAQTGALEPRVVIYRTITYW